MKKLLTLMSVACFTFSLNAQVTAAEEAASSVQQGIELPATNNTVYSVMVVRLDQEASLNYASGPAEISYDDFYQRVQNSTQEVSIDLDNGETFTMTSGPSISALNDGIGTPCPEVEAEELAQDYLDRLSALVYENPLEHDYIVFSTTGGEIGMIYARIQGSSSAGSTNVNESTDLDIKLYPNPVIDNLVVQGIPSGVYPAQIIDANGKMVKEVNLNDNSPVDVSNLSAGMYSIKFIVEKEFVIQQFQVTR